MESAHNENLRNNRCFNSDEGFFFFFHYEKCYIFIKNIIENISYLVSIFIMYLLLFLLYYKYIFSILFYFVASKHCPLSFIKIIFTYIYFVFFFSN